MPSGDAAIRWFAPNAFCTLVVPGIRAAGYSVATDGDRAADLVVSMDNQTAVEGFEFAHRHGCPLVMYLWDLPPWQLGAGKPDLIFEWGGRVRRISRLAGRHPARPGFYSRLRYVARRANAVWSPSSLTVDDVTRRFGVTPELVPYCFDSARFTPESWRRASPLRILTVSRLVPNKNQEAVLRVAARMTPRPVVELIGRGENEEPLRTLARDLGVSLQLASDRQSDEAVREAYRRATVIVAPSRFEGFGLTAIEAVACGVPAVASDIPPHREHLGSAAVYFTLDDDASLEAAIRAAIARGPVDPQRVSSLAVEAAAARFIERFRRLLPSN